MFYKTRAEFTLSINNVSSSTIISTSEALSAAIKSSSKDTIETIQLKEKQMMMFVI